MGLENDKKTEKRMHILETAYNLFKTKSVNATAVDDVVKAAGIARGTFYLYFKDKTDLLDQLVFFKSAQTMKTLLWQTEQRIQELKLPFIDGCRLFIEMFIDFLQSNKEVLTVVEKNISACLKTFPTFHDSEANELFLKITQRFMENGYTPQDAHKTIYMVVDMVGSVCSDAVLYAHPFPLNEIRQSVTDAAVALIANGMKKNVHEGDNG